MARFALLAALLVLACASASAIHVQGPVHHELHAQEEKSQPAAEPKPSLETAELVDRHPKPSEEAKIDIHPPATNTKWEIPEMGVRPQIAAYVESGTIQWEKDDNSGAGGNAGVLPPLMG